MGYLHFNRRRVVSRNSYFSASFKTVLGYHSTNTHELFNFSILLRGFPQIRHHLGSNSLIRSLPIDSSKLRHLASLTINSTPPEVVGITILALLFASP